MASCSRRAEQQRRKPGHQSSNDAMTSLREQMYGSIGQKPSIHTRIAMECTSGVLIWPVLRSLHPFSERWTRLSSNRSIDWRHNARYDIQSAARLSSSAQLMSSMARLSFSASLYRLHRLPCKLSPGCNWP